MPELWNILQRRRPVDKLVDLESSTSKIMRDFFCIGLRLNRSDIKADELRIFSCSLIGFELFRKAGTSAALEAQTGFDGLWKSLSLDGDLRVVHGQELIQKFRLRWGEYSALILPAFTQSPERGHNAVTLLMHAFERVSGRPAKGHMLSIVDSVPGFYQLMTSVRTSVPDYQ